MLFLKERRWNPIKNTQQADVLRFDLCAVCDIEDSPDKLTWYTREEVVTHIQETHAGWALCKGCGELITTAEYEKEKGWCELCVILCLDCMDEDKYGPLEPLDLPSPRPETEVAIPEPDDPGPPPIFGWLKPTLFTGYTPAESSLMASIVSGIRTVYSRILSFVEEVKRRFR
jgi:hypothetical protein